MSNEWLALHLKAQRYLLEEMTMEERTAFENLLAEGGAACDAVAESVVLAAAVELDSPAPATPVTIQRGSRPIWKWKNVVVGGGSVAALWVGSLVIFESPLRLAWETVPATAIPVEQLADVADVWSRLNEESPLGGWESYMNREEHIDREDWVQESVVGDVPEWMYAAVDASLLEMPAMDRSPTQSPGPPNPGPL